MKDILIQYMKRFSDLSEPELKEITVDIPVATFKKGTILLHQGDVPDKCYFILIGCVRQYAVDEQGNEHTYNFFTEEQSVTIFNQHTVDKGSKYSLSCLEDGTFVVGDLATEKEAYDMHPVLEEMTRKMMEVDIGAMRDDFSSFVSSTPEERYHHLMANRPGLIDRVPQYQLASYLGIKPETLSRIKKRSAHHLRMID
ncbi:Crp/Fnr family transcriptional regulator [Pontibacillus sp. ALD_SL1]|uniref:Crp/Fnr family transcriptional regulator n=1 Tax=Pontibacillus sp. ALD_SL1 TaxID=2777185 RepID=UPI001A95641E|nr:Crp/Fnr family transcriptional regulator [Pontibacillus sp. ALD_SL1]QSS98749.1 Crp/Fnr family transcriptional regulator [Pontibacillus sp. ALD_SL1]